MTQGTIKRLNQKGFGFIMADGSSKDVFFHARDVKNARFDELREGDAVEFDVVDGDKGPKAENVQLLSQ